LAGLLDRGAAGPGLGIVEPVALALGLDDPTTVGKPVEDGTGEPLGPEHPSHYSYPTNSTVATPPLPLKTTVASIGSGQITLDANASTTVSSAEAVYGTDNYSGLSGPHPCG